MNEKRNEIAVLFDLYSPLLSPRQRDVLDLYYNDDLSLSEISEDLGITRQGVRKLLFKLENTLGAAKREREIRACAEKIIALSDSLEIRAEAQKLLNL